jgi:nitroimidazol reductase NimA-like FMN-containing flavoprotein (pyridoxamine 5'-phosphate oxidase superfamily)/GNAT superfamily N-acetyltransferase
MRKENFFRSPREDAVALLARAPVVHLATSTADGAPVLRAMHAVVRGDAIWFHGSPVGEKADCAGQPAVVSAEEVVCELPSWFFGEERGCPAATFYRSAQVHGVVEEVSTREEKAPVLQAFMEKYQPEGRHAPVTASPLYAQDLDGTLVLRVPLARVDGKDKVGQNRTPEELTRILERLWERGAPLDAAAIDAIRDANPALEDPPFLATAQGVRLRCAMGADAEADVVELLEGAPWLAGVPREAIARAHRRSTAWVGALGAEGELAGSARALSDGDVAIVADVVVAPRWRRLGVGKALMRLLLDHPALRGVRTLRLQSEQAHGLYEWYRELVGSFRFREGEHAEIVLERG